MSVGRCLVCGKLYDDYTGWGRFPDLVRDVMDTRRGRCDACDAKYAPIELERWRKSQPPKAPNPISQAIAFYDAHEQHHYGQPLQCRQCSCMLQKIEVDQGTGKRYLRCFKCGALVMD